MAGGPAAEMLSALGAVSWGLRSPACTGLPAGLLSVRAAQWLASSRGSDGWQRARVCECVCVHTHMHARLCVGPQGESPGEVYGLISGVTHRQLCHEASH